MKFNIEVSKTNTHITGIQLKETNSDRPLYNSFPIHLTGSSNNAYNNYYTIGDSHITLENIIGLQITDYFLASPLTCKLLANGIKTELKAELYDGNTIKVRLWCIGNNIGISYPIEEIEDKKLDRQYKAA